MVNKNFSPSMAMALETIKTSGALYRRPGGFWHHKIDDEWSASHYGTPTIEALVSRGLAQYTDWKPGKRGKFPIVVRVCRT